MMNLLTHFTTRSAIGSTRAIGSCTGKTGSGATFSSAYKVSLRKFFEVQETVYSQSGSGWIMWAWKVRFLRARRGVSAMRGSADFSRTCCGAVGVW